MKKLLLLVGLFLFLLGTFLSLLAVSAKRYKDQFSEINVDSPFYLAEHDLRALDELDRWEYALVDDDTRESYTRAWIVVRQGRRDETEEIFEKLLPRIDPADSRMIRNIHYNLGTLFFADALDASEAGDAKAFGENIILAKIHLEEALRIDPTHTDTKYNLEKLHGFLSALESLVPQEKQERDKERYSPGRPLRDF